MRLNPNDNLGDQHVLVNRTTPRFMIGRAIKEDVLIAGYLLIPVSQSDSEQGVLLQTTAFQPEGPVSTYHVTSHCFSQLTPQTSHPCRMMADSGRRWHNAQ